MTYSSTYWAGLSAQAVTAKKRRISDLFTHNRTQALCKPFENEILFDFSRQNIDADNLNTLLELCDERGVLRRASEMAQGHYVNTTENRPALHMTMRDPEHQTTADFQKMESLVSRFAQVKTIKHIINIGIGGSSLGPELVCQALRPRWIAGRSIDFVSNIDGAALEDALRGKSLADTLFVVASKSFKTQETLQNMRSALQWIETDATLDINDHFIAVTADQSEAQRQVPGITESNTLAFPLGVGGRYSVWSAIGLPIALIAGMTVFKEFLAGAHAMDTHFLEADLVDNIPVWLGMTAVWNHTFLHYQSHVVCPYAHRLARLPAYLQQLEMESLGKSVDLEGHEIAYPVSPVLWGEPGTDAQHSFFQHLHQGQNAVSLDFIVSATANTPAQQTHHTALLANCLAQASALMHGRTAEATAMQGDIDTDLIAWCTFDGNRPSTTILCRDFTPYTLGALLALYEHKVFVQAAIWNINPFDQFGVEYGKTMAKGVQKALDGQIKIKDTTTQYLIDQIKSWNNT